MCKKKWGLFLTATACLILGIARADEGMWTFDNLPLKAMEERYSFKPTPEWVAGARLASLRLSDGGSGSFVSPQGLVLTNHHVASTQLQKISTERKDYLKDGFFARTRAEEVKCPDLEIHQLVSIEDVTARVSSAVKPGVPDREQNAARKAERARIEKESMDKTGMLSEVVELYGGGEYWLYRYKKHTDVRLVAAPELQAASFGGDPDNFTYPRHDLDFAFFRVYEDGKPVRSEHYFRWSKSGATDRELVFVTGHPGSTYRQYTMTQLEYQRDTFLPDRIKRLERRRSALEAYASGGPEQKRRALDDILGVLNSLKARRGMLAGLRDPGLMAKLEAQERDFAGRVAGDPKLKETAGGAWERIASAQSEMARRHKEYTYRRFWSSPLAGFADTIVRYSVEIEKPNEDRYEEFRDSALESLKFQLFSPAPVYADLEQALLADSLRQSLDALGPDDPFVKSALGGLSPEEAAKSLVSRTKLADPAFRKSLFEGGRKAVESSTDPLIVLARKVDPAYREMRKWYEDNIQSAESLEGGRIAQARFAVYGKSAYPDATFTLRLSYGKVAGYDQGTDVVPWKTTFYDLFGRSAGFDGKPPYDLAPALAAHRGDLDLATPLNFVFTNDSTGGNSGSPVINRDRELVGLLFDGNIQGLVWDYAFTEETGRSIAVHSSAIPETLRKVYGMGALADELQSK